MKAFIQVQQNGEWLNENCYSAAHMFNRMGYDIEKFSIETLDLINVVEDDVVHGGITGVRKVLDNLGCKQPEIHNPHTHLLWYTGRTFRETVFGEVLKEYSQSSITSSFIKPLEDHKLFTGFVVDSYSSLIKLAHLSKDTKILQSSVENYVSEYRCFVNRRVLVGCKNYSGRFDVLPNFDTITAAIEDYEQQPVAYTLDFAITDRGETQLIEINDGFALGAYGLNSFTYCKMIRDRWSEMVKSKKDKI